MHKQQAFFFRVINVPGFRRFVIEFDNGKSHGFPKQLLFSRLRESLQRQATNRQRNNGKCSEQTPQSQFLTSLNDLSRSLMASSTSGLVVFSIGARRSVLPYRPPLPMSRPFWRARSLTCLVAPRAGAFVFPSFTNSSASLHPLPRTSPPG